MPACLPAGLPAPPPALCTECLFYFKQPYVSEPLRSTAARLTFCPGGQACLINDVSVTDSKQDQLSAVRLCGQRTTQDFMDVLQGAHRLWERL